MLSLHTEITPIWDVYGPVTPVLPRAASMLTSHQRASGSVGSTRPGGCRTAPKTALRSPSEPQTLATLFVTCASCSPASSPLTTRCPSTRSSFEPSSGERPRSGLSLKTNQGPLPPGGYFRPVVLHVGGLDPMLRAQCYPAWI
eukprot:1186058-Prorocentrum_minimum.AAC.2